MRCPDWALSKRRAIVSGESPSGETVTAPAFSTNCFGVLASQARGGDACAGRPGCHRGAVVGPAISLGLEKGPQLGWAAERPITKHRSLAAELVGRLQPTGVRPRRPIPASTPRGSLAIGDRRHRAGGQQIHGPAGRVLPWRLRAWRLSLALQADGRLGQPGLRTIRFCSRWAAGRAGSALGDTLRRSAAVFRRLAGAAIAQTFQPDGQGLTTEVTAAPAEQSGTATGAAAPLSGGLEACRPDQELGRTRSRAGL